MAQFESRLLGDTSIEVRAAGDKEVIRFNAIQYDKWSETLGGFFRERIVPGAADHLLDGDVYSVINHDNNQILGRTSNNRLSLKREGNNVVAEVAPPAELSYVKDLKVNIAERNIVGASFRFTVDPEGETWDTTKEIYERTITKFSGLYEVGPVTNPAYKGDSVTITKRDVDDKTTLPPPADTEGDATKETQELQDIVTQTFITL